MMKKSLFLALTAFCAVAGRAENYYPVEDLTPGKWFVDSVRHSRPEMEKSFLEKLDKMDPYAERARCSEIYHRMLEEKFYSNRVEDAAIEKALNWKKGDFTWHNNKFFARPGCTSWIVTSEASSTGSYIVQKNRDYIGQKHFSLRMFRSAPGRFKVVTVGDLWNSGAGAAMNEKGVMIVQNDGTSRERHPQKVNIGCTFILRYIAEHCANLQEAAEVLKKFHTTGLVRSASIYLLADLNSGMVLEGTSGHHAFADVPFAFEVRANNYLLPGMRNISRRTQKSFLNGANRRFTASEFLRTTWAEKGKISPADLMKLARLRDPKQESEKFRQICCKYTLISTMFVPDRTFPSYLSATYVALGPVRHMVFLPVPMGLSALPESLTNGQWGSKALKLAEKMPLDHDKLALFEKLEGKFIAEFEAVKARARLLLMNGKNAEAVKLLDELFRKQYAEANAFMDQLAAASGK